MRKSRWVVCAKRADFQAIAERFHIDQVTARILRNRDLLREEEIESFLHGDLGMLPAPEALRGVREAAGILKRKIAEGKKIRIIGDYDVDGVCSVYILKRALERLGARVDYDIPERTLDGYGLNLRLVSKAAAERVDTLLTCDNGIAALEETRAAKAAGMTVVITDHHQPVTEERDGGRQILLPEADALIDPSIPGQSAPGGAICGAVVAWKLAQSLAGDLQRDCLPYAAVATIADVMNLSGENRIIVREGLKALEDITDTGMRALLAAAGLGKGAISAGQVGFVLGPCINASGRLDTARRALELFFCRNQALAAQMAQELVELNRERRALTEEALFRAQSQLEEEHRQEDQVLVLYLPGCHESLAGIVAGRVRERYYRPAFVLTDAAEEGMLKGSGRSIEAYPMHERLSGVSSLLEGFGGHPMAAGLRIKRENLDQLREKLNQTSLLRPEELVETKRIDVPVPLYYLSEKLVSEFSLLEPFGRGNERPVFALKQANLKWGRVLGEKRNVFRCRVADVDGTAMDGVWFGDTSELLDYLEACRGPESVKQLLSGQGLTASVLYTPQINEYQGSRSIQLRLLDFA